MAASAQSASTSSTWARPTDGSNRSARLARLAAYVMASTTVTRASGYRWATVRTKLAPMNPAPPVTTRRMAITLPPRRRHLGLVLNAGGRVASQLAVLGEHLLPTPGPPDRRRDVPRCEHQLVFRGDPLPQLPDAEHFGIAPHPVDHGDVDQPQPQQEHDHTGERPVHLVEVAEVGHEEVEAQRGHPDHHERDSSSEGDPTELATRHD